MNREKNGLSLSAFRGILRNTRRVVAIIWKEKRGIAVLLLAVLVVLSITPFLRSGSLGILINQLVGNIQTGMITSGLVWAFVFFIAAGVLTPVFFPLQNYLSKQFWFFLEEKFELLLIKKKGELDLAVHENPEYNDLFNKVRENGIWRMQNFADRQFFIFQNMLEAFVSFAIIAVANPWILILIVAGGIPELIAEAKYGKEVWGIYGSRAEVRRRFWDLREHFEKLPSLVELKLFQNTAHFIGIIKEIFSGFQKEQKKIETKKLVTQLITSLFSQVALIFAIVWFVRQVLHGNLQVGTLTFFLASIGELRQSLSGLFSNLGRQYQDSLFVSDIFKLLDISPAIAKPAAGIALNPNKTPEIVFSNVTFRYPGAKKPALKNFSVTIAPGEKIALVGVNGAGKTTFVKLLCRFYDPDSGTITIDGRDIKDIDLESWYYQLGALFQDYSNYHFIVKEAIALGRTSVRHQPEKVKEAAETSEADMFIKEWEKSYEQMLGKQFTGGVEPSIGQWQKLALARTFYRDPKIFILDEPTSSIDAEAEAKIFDRLEALPKDRTVILISHRFSTVRHAHKICVIKGGVLKELGTHRRLIRLNGIYARLFHLQAKGYR